MPKLNPNAQLWVDALRSGNYKQGKEVLRYVPFEGDPPAFCCLGVACDVAAASGLDVEPNGNGGYNEQECYLPALVKDWLGLKSDRGHFSEKAMERGNDKDSLVWLNDVELKTFTEIADFIEANAVELGVAGRETELAEVGR